jgi:hypothetical protein
MQKINIRDNKELMRFETGEGDNTAYLEYRFYKRINIALMHTVVPDHYGKIFIYSLQ